MKIKLNIDDLATQGFATVNYPSELKSAIMQTHAAWEDFCRLPAGVKRKIPYSNSSAGAGYEDNRTLKSSDNKEKFDICLADAAWLRTDALHRVDTEYFYAADDLVKLGLSALEQLFDPIYEIAVQIERQCEVLGFANEIERSKLNMFLRFIHYFPSNGEGEETAEAHVDQSGLTLHLFESAPGFQALTPKERTWTDVAFPKGSTVLIPAMQMQLRSQGRLEALCHRVISTPETAKVGRYSAVCFVQFRDTPKYDKATHGRLQEKSPGFNYGMPHEEFRKLFK